jgi:small GTP-binding protein
MSNPHVPRSYTFKVLVVGDMGAGKTSLIRRYVKNEFTFQYKTTIGVDFATRMIEFENGDTVQLQLWDIAGQERFGNLFPSYCRGVGGIIYVFDISRELTLNNLIKWKKEMTKHTNGIDIPAIVLACKSDLNEEYMYVTVDQFVKDEYISCGWFKASAKDNYGIEEPILTLAMEMKNIFSHQGEAIQDQNVVKLNLAKEEEIKEKGKCC